MVTANRVADMPALASASTQLAKVGGVIKKVPLKTWRSLALLLAFVWMAHSIAAVFWLLIPLPKPETQPVVAAQLSQASVSRKTVDIKKLQTANLYGEFKDVPIVAQVKDIPKEKPVEKVAGPTKLNLKLQGVIAASTQEASWAIIGETNSQKLFKVGDKLPRVNGVTLVEVQERQIILDNNGTREFLRLYEGDGKDFASSGSASQSKPARPNRSSADRVPPKRAGPEKKVVDAKAVRKAKSIGDVVRFMVATEGGKMIGYKVRPGRKRELFDQAGLKNDDIVISVNGIEVNEPQKVREVYQALKTATEANLEILRDGSTHSIQISMSGD